MVIKSNNFIFFIYLFLSNYLILSSPEILVRNLSNIPSVNFFLQIGPTVKPDEIKHINDVKIGETKSTEGGPGHEGHCLAIVRAFDSTKPDISLAEFKFVTGYRETGDGTPCGNNLFIFYGKGTLVHCCGTETHPKDCNKFACNCPENGNKLIHPSPISFERFCLNDASIPIEIQTAPNTEISFTVQNGEKQINSGTGISNDKGLFSTTISNINGRLAGTNMFEATIHLDPTCILTSKFFVTHAACLCAVLHYDPPADLLTVSIAKKYINSPPNILNQ